jgi:hypothetical protein
LQRAKNKKQRTKVFRRVPSDESPQMKAFG